MDNRTTSKICIKCQECCKRVGVHSIYPYSKEIIDFYETRGAKVKKVTLENGLDIALIEFELRCPFLDDEKGCLIYVDRPSICRNYPEDESQMLENCQLRLHGLI